MAHLARKSSLLAALSLGLTLIGGCGEDFNKRVTCATVTDCAIGLSASDMTSPECCGTYCVFPAAGCDSGYRYLTTEPGFGDCVADPMCPAVPDQSVAHDMSGPNDDAS